MPYDLIRPCKHCPFRTDCLEGWLGEERAEEIAASLKRAEFPCHETTVSSEDGWERISVKTSQHCAGALIVLEKMEQPSQMMRIAERLRIYNRHRLDMTAPVFEDLDQFIEHHSDF